MNTRLDRRTFLRGASVSLAVPWLECMGATSTIAAPATTPPKRFLALYVGHGFAITRNKDNKGRNWSWYPRVTEDGTMTFGKSMSGFNEFKDRTSVYYGLEHPRVVSFNGHGTADSFLTGSKIDDAVRSPSLDQVAALVHGKKTRYPSLVLGNESGLGSSGGSRTLSYNRFGRPIPAVNDVQKIYDSLFNSDPKLQEDDIRRLRTDKRLVDRVLESHKDLKRRLGKSDSEKLDHYLHSLNEVEQDLIRLRLWLDKPKPKVDSRVLDFEAGVKAPESFVRTMYNLIFLAFQTDSTRYATYMLQNMSGGAWNQMPRTALGLGGSHHDLAHGAAGQNPKALERLGTFDKFHGDLLAEFIKKLDSVQEANGTLLDNTVIMYGSSNSRTHVNRDYPMMICGGSNLGFKHGSLYELQASGAPLNNLYTSILNALDVPTEKFSDSKGELTQVMV
jgi:hypothetical protein